MGDALRYEEQRQEISMWDIGCVAASVGFFWLAMAYTRGCGKLGAKESKS